MKGTLVNVAAILAGSLAGMAFRRNFPEKYQKTITQVLGLSVGVIGLEMALKSPNMIIVIISLVIGAALGEALNIEDRLDRLGARVAKAIGNKGGQESASLLGKGFVTASLIYCVGAMAVVGAIQDGLAGDARVLYAKSVLDGILSVVLTSSMGAGVIFSSVPVLLYQGSITLLAETLAPLFSEQVVAQLTATGGILIIGISLVLLEIKKIKLANLLPAIPVAIIISHYWP